MIASANGARRVYKVTPNAGQNARQSARQSSGQNALSRRLAEGEIAKFKSAKTGRSATTVGRFRVQASDHSRKIQSPNLHH